MVPADLAYLGDNEHMAISQETQPVAIPSTPSQPVVESQPPLEPKPQPTLEVKPLSSSQLEYSGRKSVGSMLSNFLHLNCHRATPEEQHWLIITFYEENKTPIGILMAKTNSFTAKDAHPTLPDFHNFNIGNSWARSTPSLLTTPPALNPAQAPTCAPVQPPARVDLGCNTTTQDSDEDANGPPPIKCSHIQWRTPTMLTLVDSGTAMEPKSNKPLKPLPPELQLCYPSRAVSKPRAPGHHPAEDSKPVPETNPKILAERVPRYQPSVPTSSQLSAAATSQPSATATSQPNASAPSQPCTCGGAQSHIGGSNPSYPTPNHNHSSSGHESVQDHANQHPLPLPATRPLPQPARTNSPALHRQSSYPKRCATVTAKRQAIKKQLEQMANPPTPKVDAQKNVLNDMHACLKTLAKAIVGRLEPAKKPKPSKKAHAGPSSHCTGCILSQVEEGQERLEALQAEEGKEDKDEEEEDAEQRAANTHAEASITLIKPTLTQADIEHNLNVLWYIYPSQFHRTNVRHCTSHYKRIIVPHTIAVALFYGKNSVGVLFHEYFNPIPAAVLAFILTTANSKELLDRKPMDINIELPDTMPQPSTLPEESHYTAEQKGKAHKD
ncbi:hypothetical protein FRC07_004395 [Ceratobasidium sp. 392]|nr:hypothetical protein FRC07_004395 [Ceratobasidium sp. 392]